MRNAESDKVACCLRNEAVLQGSRVLYGTDNGNSCELSFGKLGEHYVIGRSPVVRLIVAIACVSVLIPCTNAHAQSRTQGTKAPPTAGKAKSSPSTGPRTQGIPAKSVSRTQESGTDRAEEPAEAAPEDGAGKVVLQNEHLIQKAPPMSPELQKELDRLLEYWSAASDRIDRLEGKHFRIVYDTLFGVERQSEGEFAYEKPDKGRIDITPVKITPQLIEARKKEADEAKAEGRKSQVRLKENGDPFVLAVSPPEQWSCDGQRVYNMDLEKKEAQVAQLPAVMQGRNIMDSPLPFLFGMPPEAAKRRFTIFFAGNAFDAKSGRAYLTIYPRLPQDATNWKQADIILDLKDFLPIAVQLLDPAGTKVTVYKFRDFVKNQPDWKYRIKGINPNARFTPNLQGFKVHLVNNEQAPAITLDGVPGNVRQPIKPVDSFPAPDKGEPNGLVNVGGLPHETAVIQLQRQGLMRSKEKDTNEIILEKGPPAEKPADVYTVKSQEPKPGTPITRGMKVKLTIWTDPAAEKQ